jgi:hypothetical protein
MDYLSTQAVDKSGKKWFFEETEQNHPIRPAGGGGQGIY